jgi:hypothetical protein
MSDETPTPPPEEPAPWIPPPPESVPLAGSAEGKPARPRWKKRLFIALVAIVVLAAGASLGALLGAQHEDHHWAPLYNQAVTEVAHWKSDSQTWHKTSQGYLQSSQTYQGQLQDLQAKIGASVGDLNNPSFVLWNSCGAGGPAAGCSLTPGYEYIAGVPDTFTYFVNFRSTVPVTVWIMSSSNFVCWETHLCAWKAVGWQNQTDLQNGVFHTAEGCAGYFAVFFSAQSGTLYPDVRITRHPAAHPTGVCR